MRLPGDRLNVPHGPRRGEDVRWRIGRQRPGGIWDTSAVPLITTTKAAVASPGRRRRPAACSSTMLLVTSVASLFSMFEMPDLRGRRRRRLSGLDSQDIHQRDRGQSIVERLGIAPSRQADSHRALTDYRQLRVADLKGPTVGQDEAQGPEGPFAEMVSKLFRSHGRVSPGR